MSAFIVSHYKDGRYRPVTIGSSLSGLRRFLSSNDHTALFLLEIPVHLPREVKIMEVYNDKEIAALRSTRSSGMLTKSAVLEHILSPLEGSVSQHQYSHIFLQKTRSLHSSKNVHVPALYCCGFRCKEARTLARVIVHLDQGYLDIVQSKGPKSRRIYICKELTGYLADYDWRISCLFPNRMTFFPN